MSSGALALDAVGACLPGPDGNYTEDDFRVAPSRGLAMVATGMGAIGGQGRPSAKLAIWSVLGHVEYVDGLQAPRAAMREGLLRADEAISRLFHGGTLSPPVAMFAGVLLAGERCVLAHVGAARIYHLRGSTLVSVSQDHTLATLCAAEGLELPTPAHARIVTHALGFLRDDAPTLREVDVRVGDRFVLSTRPLHEALSEDAIVEAASLAELEDARDELFARRHPDYNRYRAATAIVAQVVRGEPRHRADGLTRRPPHSWLYDPGLPLPEPPGLWPQPDEAWFREVYGLVMGDDG